jgi:hypothetical protein
MPKYVTTDVIQLFRKPEAGGRTIGALAEGVELDSDGEVFSDTDKGSSGTVHRFIKVSAKSGIAGYVLVDYVAKVSGKE